MDNPIGNSTTIINTIIVAVAGIIFGKWGATLLQLGIDQKILVEIISFVVFTVFAYVNAKHHNNLFDGQAESTEPAEPIFNNDAPVLNDEYEFTGDENDGC